MKKTPTFFLISIISITLAASVSAQTQKEQLRQMIGQLQTMPSDSALRERIIKFAAAMRPTPDISDAALNFEGRGRAAYADAKSTDDYVAAAKEYEKAIAADPWIVPYYKALTMIYEKAGKLEDAKRVCGFYLTGLTDPTQILETKRQIAGLEFRIEKAGTVNAEADRERRDMAQRNALLLQLSTGKWEMKTCDGSQTDSHEGCTDSERKGSYWYWATQGYGSKLHKQYEFNDPVNGSMQLTWLIGQCGTGSDWELEQWAIAKGSTFGDIRWEVRKKGSSSGREMYSEIASDGSSLLISCDRPLYGAGSGVRYHYTQYIRP